MIVRYYNYDYSVPCLENEFLFSGTKEECIKYIFKHWAVDMLEPNAQTFLSDLKHIQIGQSRCPLLFSDEIIKEMYDKGRTWENKCDWENINPQHFTFNKDVIEIQ